MFSEVRGRLQERRAQREARYDRPPPRWAALVPSVGVLLLSAADLAYPRGHHRETVSLVAAALYVVLLIGWGSVAWSWHRRHLVAQDRPAIGWRRVIELGPQTRARALAPVGLVLFAFLAGLMAVHVVEGIADRHWGQLVSAVIGLPIFGVLALRCGLATRRPLHR